MGKKKDKKKDKKKEKQLGLQSALEVELSSEAAEEPAAEPEQPDSQPMKRKEYEAELETLHGELVKLQEWVKAKGMKVCVIFEGRDTAGKGGVIKAITERTSPRVFRVVALPTPTDKEKSQLYYQRYVPHLPSAGEVVLFDRSWYNRAGVERVMGFATMQQVEQFLREVPAFEKAIVDSGTIFVKYWLDVSMENQAKRFEERLDDPRKLWKLSPIDLEAQKRWYDYSRARDAMFAATDTLEAPWYVVDANDQRRARLNCIAHLLSLVPYEELPRPVIKLPKRQDRGDYVEPDYPYRYVPAKY
jgi:polyphosphate kinase 2